MMGCRDSRIGSSRPPGLDLRRPPTPRAPSRRFARLVESPAARRVAAGRLGRTLLVLAAVAGLVVIGGSSVSRTVVAWLHRRPEYRIKFSEIALDPPPPPWIKGGGEALLESVRAGRKHLESLSILDLDLDHLLTDVRRNPWVARVERAEKSYSNRLSGVPGPTASRSPSSHARPRPADAGRPRRRAALPADELDISPSPARSASIEGPSRRHPP